MTTLARAIAALGLVLAAWILRGSKSRDEVVRASVVHLAVGRPWLTAGAMAIGLTIMAGVLVVSGAVPIKASSGHWRITAAVLDFAKVRSVTMHAWGTEAPPLDDDALVLRGAGHYESACLPCHGGPGRRMPPVMAGMTPPPPELTRRLARWTPEELFSIVKHGIKFTGMPAWPAQQRNDEVWAMVAFLRRLPQLDAAAYRRLVYGERGPSDEPSSASVPASPLPPAAVRTVCWRCHGLDGTGRGRGAFPSVAGQRAGYLEASLRAFANGSRFSGMMTGIAAGLSDDDMRTVAAYYARLPPRAGQRRDESPTFARGAAIAARGVPERDIPPCIECHGPTDGPKNPTYPRLTGQHVSYLTQQLRLLRERQRGGSPNVDLMHVFVERLQPSEIRDVTLYYGSAAPPRATADRTRDALHVPSE